MLRCVILFSLCTCFSLTSIAQGLGANPSNLRINPRDQQPEDRRVTPRVVEGATISIARLREPRTAQKLYLNALNALAKQNYVETQRKLDQALKIYPPFPEAMTLYGITHAVARQWEQAEQNLQTAIQTDPGMHPRTSYWQESTMPSCALMMHRSARSTQLPPVLTLGICSTRLPGP